jgi:hypothetical protein
VIVNQRIIMRGMGPNQLLCTRGYGRLARRIREVIHLCSCLAQRIFVRSPWKPTA